MINRTAPLGTQVDYGQRFYENFEEKVSYFFFVKFRNVKIFLSGTIQLRCVREYES